MASLNTKSGSLIQVGGWSSDGRVSYLHQIEHAYNPQGQDDLLHLVPIGEASVEHITGDAITTDGGGCATEKACGYRAVGGSSKDKPELPGPVDGGCTDIQAFVSRAWLMPVD